MRGDGVMLGCLKLLVAMAAAFAVALVSAFLWGKSKQAAQQKAKDLRACNNTRKDIDLTDNFNNSAAAFNWLQQRKSNCDL